MAARAYKKYMKKTEVKDYSLLKLFTISFFGMLLVFTFIIKSFTPSVDVSIGDYKQEDHVEVEEVKKVVDGRLAMIQEEDRGKDFTEVMKSAEDAPKEDLDLKKLSKANENPVKDVEEAVSAPQVDPMYKVYIGNYTSAEQARVAKDIILESGSSLNPIVKCIGSNNYTLQVGIFKNKDSADTLLYSIQQSNLPGRIIQEY